jgi:hypothetical protein
VFAFGASTVLEQDGIAAGKEGEDGAGPAARARRRPSTSTRRLGFASGFPSLRAALTVVEAAT